MEGDLSFANWYAVLDILVQKYVENNIEIIIKKYRKYGCENITNNFLKLRFKYVNLSGTLV